MGKLRELITGKEHPKPTIGALIRKTPGGRHAWYEATASGDRIMVRKPLNELAQTPTK